MISAQEQDILIDTENSNAHTYSVNGSIFHDFQVWNPSSKQLESSTVGKTSDDLVMLSGDSDILINQTKRPISDLVNDADGWSNFELKDINSHGMIVGIAEKGGATKVVALLKMDVDIIHPASGELSEAKEDINDGGYVSIKREIDEDDVAPVTQLKLHANSSLPSAAKFRLKFANGNRYKIYSDDTRQTLVQSEVTEFDVGSPTTLYFQGIGKSQSRGGEEITMQIGVGGNWYDGDSVKCTVVQSEFPVVIRAFIPYLWSEPEQPASFLDAILGVLYTVIAEGDDRKSIRKIDSDEVSYRARQRVVLTPYKDLHTSFDLSAAREANVADLSKHHVKQLSVPLLDFFDKHGDRWDSNGPSLHKDGEPKFESKSYQKNSHVDKVVSVNLIGSSEDGAMPWYIPGALTPNIDWNVRVSLDAYADPLNPRISVIGTRDKFPAYEIIFQESDNDYEELYFFSPPYSRQPGITTLGFSEDFTTDIVTIK